MITKKEYQGSNEIEIYPDSLIREEHDKNIKISLLLNNVYYFLQYVFILLEKGSYRLVVIHNEQVKTDRCSANIIDAKIAFADLYNDKS